MKRQDFAVKLRLLGAAAMLLATGALLPGCGEATNEDTPVTEYVFDTSIEAGHQHTVRLAKTTVETPAQAELELRTSTEAGHNHGLRLSPAELRTLNEGGAVTRTTTIDDGHSHTVFMQRP